ncbi:MAG: MFS transporter [Actinomycetota bacterium]
MTNGSFPVGVRRRVLAVACLSVFMIVSSLSALNVALAEVADALSAEIEDLQWIVDAYAVTFAGLLLAGGAIGDRVGRRAALLCGYAVFGIANALAAVVDSVGPIVGLRALAGLGAALIMPASLAAVSEVYDDGGRPQAIAIWSSIAAAGGAFGPFLGGALVTAAGWPSVFSGNAAMAALGLVGAVAWVPTLRGRRVGPFDVVGAGLSVAAVASLIYLVIEGPRHPFASTSLLALALTIALTVWFVRHEGRSKHPLLPLDLLRDRSRVAGAGTLVLAALGFNGVFFVGSLGLQIGWGESGLVAGLLLVPIGVVEVGVANVAIRFARRTGLENALTIGLCFMAVGYVGMGFTPAGNRLWFVLAGVIAGVGNGLTIPLSVERIMGTVEPAFAGAAASVNDMAIELGASAGIGLLGTVQGLWFEARRPDGRTTPISDIVDGADRTAFRGATAAAFGVAAAVALAAIPVARSTLRLDAVSASRPRGRRTSPPGSPET